MEALRQNNANGLKASISLMTPPKAMTHITMITIQLPASAKESYICCMKSPKDVIVPIKAPITVALTIPAAKQVRVGSRSTARRIIMAIGIIIHRGIFPS